MFLRPPPVELGFRLVRKAQAILIETAQFIQRESGKELGRGGAVTTLTTVGYGDVYPITIGGRIFTFLVLMLGLGVVAVPTGLISSALSETISAEKNHSTEP